MTNVIKGKFEFKIDPAKYYKNKANGVIEQGHFWIDLCNKLIIPKEYLEFLEESSKKDYLKQVSNR